MASYFYPQGRGSGRGGGRDAVSFYSPGLVVASARPRTCCVATPLVEHMTSLGRAAAALAYFRYGMAARGVRASLRALALARVYIAARLAYAGRLEPALIRSHTAGQRGDSARMTVRVRIRHV